MEGVSRVPSIIIGFACALFFVVVLLSVFGAWPGVAGAREWKIGYAVLFGALAVLAIGVELAIVRSIGRHRVTPYVAIVLSLAVGALSSLASVGLLQSTARLG